MMIRMVLRPIMNKLVGKGIDLAAGGGKSGAEMTDAERRKAAKGKQTAKRARQAGRLVRRFGRF